MRKLTVDILSEIVYTDSSETTSGNVLASIPVVFCCHTTTAYFDTKRSTEGAPTGGLPQVMQSFPDDLLYYALCFKSQELQMSGNTESTTKDPAVSTPHYWELFACDGPAELYRGFAIDAVDEFLHTQDTITDEQMSIITECVNIAATVALRAAGVSDSWLPMYQAAVKDMGTK